MVEIQYHGGEIMEEVEEEESWRRFHGGSIIVDVSWWRYHEGAITEELWRGHLGGTCKA